MIPVLLLWLLVVIGVPLFALFAAAALGLLLDAPGGGWEAVAVDVFGAKLGESPTLMTVPLLVFAGLLLAEAGLTQHLQSLAGASRSWLPLPVAAALWLACALVTTFAVGPIVAGCAVLLLPALRRAQVRPTAVPSDPARALAPPRSAPAHAGPALRRVAGALSVPLLFAASLAFGLRPYEAAAASVFAALVVASRALGGLAVRRDLLRVTSEAVSVVGVVLAVAITAIGFDAWLVHADTSAQLLDWLDGLALSRTAFLLLANGLLLAACWLLDLVPALLLIAPLLLPFANHQLVDVYELAVVFLLNAELARLSGWPPSRLRAAPAPAQTA